MLNSVAMALLTARFRRELPSMAMRVESLEVLEKADVAPAQARAIVRAIEIELTGAKDMLATKADISELRSELKAEFHAIASSITRQMYLAVLGQMAVLLGFAYFFATHIR
jgi:hypothetical protein